MLTTLRLSSFCAVVSESKIFFVSCMDLKPYLCCDVLLTVNLHRHVSARWQQFFCVVLSTKDWLWLSVLNTAAELPCHASTVMNVVRSPELLLPLPSRELLMMTGSAAYHHHPSHASPKCQPVKKKKAYFPLWQMQFWCCTKTFSTFLAQSLGNIELLVPSALSKALNSLDGTFTCHQLLR